MRTDSSVWPSNQGVTMKWVRLLDRRGQHGDQVRMAHTPPYERLSTEQGDGSGVLSPFGPECFQRVGGWPIGAAVGRLCPDRRA